VLEIVREIDVKSQTSANHVKVFAVQEKRAVDDIEENLNIPNGRRFRIHRREQRPNELDKTNRID